MRFSRRRSSSAVLLCLLAVSTACSTVIGIDGNYSDSSGGEGGGSGNASRDAGSTTCSGTPVSGVCWYLGELGESCASACSSHSGESPNAASFVGIPAQGGSWAKCASLLTALGSKAIPVLSSRTDGSGLGCHYFSGQSYWLYSPEYSSSAKNAAARLVCGCAQ
jgi:hypothetical protein